MFSICLFMLLTILSASVRAQDSSAKNWNVLMWYDHPAAQWVEALPVGNGRLGAMVFGNIQNERIQFNEDTLWSSGPVQPRSKYGPGALAEIRRLIFAGEYDKAQKLFTEKMAVVPEWYARYQPFGDLWIDFHDKRQVEDYRRELDLDTAIARVSYRIGGVRFEREIFASPVDQVIVVRLSATKPGSISFTARLTGVKGDEPWSRDGYYMEEGIEPDSLVLRGRNCSAYGVKGQLEYQARVKAIAQGGKVIVSGKDLTVEKANTVTLLLPAATSFVNYKDVSADPEKRIEDCLAKLGNKSYDSIRKDHIAEHQRLFRRVSIDIVPSDASSLPTDERIKAFARGGSDPQLGALAYQFGRYSLISSSRPGNEPGNLQGLWNQDPYPSWDCKYTTNINLEMNYWPADTGNLSECTEPLTEMILELAEAGKFTARDSYGAGGWLLGFNTDIWRNTSPIGDGMFGSWATGGAWLSTHLWEHYLFTGDTQYLEKVYLAMKGAAQFFLDALQEHPTKKWLVTCPSNSPENDYKIWKPARPWSFDTPVICAGPTMDMQILRYLFGSVADAADILGVDQGFRDKVLQTRKRLAPNQIGKYGQLQEWLDDWDDPKDDHRHFSHLWGMYPGKEISVKGTPELARAVKQSLIFRGERGTGFGQAWQMCIWARMYEPEIAHRLFRNLMRDNTFPNLFSNCYGALQVDGTFGCAAGIAEMLLQSQAGEIHLLPALPNEWSTGHVEGLCARGGFEVDIRWENGKLVETTIRSKLGKKCRLRYGNKQTEFDTPPGKEYRFDRSLNIL